MDDKTRAVMVEGLEALEKGTKHVTMMVKRGASERDVEPFARDLTRLASLMSERLTASVAAADILGTIDAAKARMGEKPRAKHLKLVKG